MMFACEFREDKNCPRKFYRCYVSSKTIPENTEIRFHGSHVNGRRNADVDQITFAHCTLSRVPQGLTKSFPNLKSIEIFKSKLKNLTKADLVEYQKFQKLHFVHNYLQYLSADLFEGFVALEEISFLYNQLKLIEPKILDGLNFLAHVDFSNNPNYDKCYSKLFPIKSNATLDEVKMQLVEKSMLPVKNIPQSSGSGPKNKPDYKFQKGFNFDFKNFIQADDKFRDFVIKIEDREFPVHKLVLAARSPTLAMILRNNPEAENLNLVDIPVEIFEKIIKFIYNDEYPEDERINHLQLFSAAGQLKIKELLNFTAAKLMQKLDGTNAFDILNLSHKYGHDVLNQKSFAELKKKYPQFQFEDEWAHQPDKLVEIIIFLNKKEEMMKEELEKLILKKL